MTAVVLVDCEATPVTTTDHYYTVSRTEPIGLLMLESFLERNGISATVVRTPLGAAEWRLLDSAEVIGISSLTYSWPDARLLALRIRERCPRALLVAGREHAACAPEEALENALFDVVVVGAGEVPLLGLVRGDDWSEIPGIVFRNVAGELVRNRRAEVPPLSYPLRRRSEWMTNMLQESSSLFTQMGGVILGRGCPFKCTFCTAPTMWERFIPGDVGPVVSEVRSVIEENGVRYIAFHDLMLNADQRRLQEFARAAIDADIDASFFGMMSATTAKHDFPLLHRAGFNEIGVGIEVPTDRRRAVGKGAGISVAKSFTKAISEAGIFVRAYLIIGWPWETDADEVVDTYVRALSELPVNALRIHFLTPFPGTSLWEEHRHDLLLPPDVDSYRHFTTMEPVLRFHLDRATLIRVRERIFRGYYTGAAYRALAARQTSATLRAMNGAFYDHVERTVLRRDAVALGVA